MNETFAQSVCLSFDLDWAPDFMIDDLRGLLSDAGVPFTAFCTHRSPAVERLTGLARCEVAVHPNLLGAADEDGVLRQLLGLFPDVQGIRNHALYYHSRLLPLMLRNGLRYFSNDLMFLEPSLRPFYDWSGMLRLPIYWEDDVHCVFFDEQFDCDCLHLGRAGMKVFNFHPVHIYLNTRRLCDYQRAKGGLANEDVAQSFRNSQPGIRTLFRALLERLCDIELETLSEVAVRYAQQHSYQGVYRVR